MKILHVISQRPECTGSGIYIRTMIKEALARAHENYLLAGVPKTGYPSIQGIPAKNQEFVEFEGADLVFPVVGMSDTMPYRSHRFRDLTDQEFEQYQSIFIGKLRKFVQKVKPDIIHCHHLWLLTSFTRELFPNFPVVATCHGTGIRQLEICPRFKKRVLSSCSELDRIFALSLSQAKTISSTYGIDLRRIRVVGGGYDEDLFKPGKSKKSDVINIVYAGKLSQSKGVFWLLNSLLLIKNHSWRLHLAGSANEDSSQVCQQMAARLGENVKFHGMLSQLDLAKLMRECHIFILPSFYEGLPLVVLEALASGCRVIVTSLPGTQEIFESHPSEYVRLVDLPPLETVDRPFEKDKPMLQKQLARVMDQEILKAITQPNLPAEFGRSILKQYTWKAVFHRVESAYKELLTSK